MRPFFAYSPSARPLVLLACSGTKLDRPAKAIELYKGVMYTTLAKHQSADAPPNVLILSAEHGFVSPDSVIAPYNRRMTVMRADEMLSDLCRFNTHAAWPREIGKAFLAGGAESRRVMWAMLAALYPEAVPFAGETSGGIGQQRAQLGAFLRAAYR